MRTNRIGTYAKAVEETRKKLIVKTLKSCNGDASKCADILGITYCTVRLRAKKYNYHLEDMRHYNSGRR
jgi:DNA-binding NtrC family response regulator